MLKKIILIFAGMFIGCAAAVSIPAVTAQTGTEAAAPGQFSECFATTVTLVRGVDLNEGEMPERTVRVPPGWTPIGGGAAQGGSVAILCR